MRQPNPSVQPERAREILDKAQSSAGAEHTVRLCCKLITPMYGGGVKAGEVDRDLPIRTSALRGQLRFWWRLLNRGNRSASDLFAAESELWGGISKQGPRVSGVTLQVRSAPVRDQEMVTKNDLVGKSRGGFPAYALITEPRENPSFLNVGYSFELALRFEPSISADQRSSVIEALRWWANFAGVGARTRRGFGAVEATSEGRKLEPVSPDDVRQHGGRMVIGRRSSDATEAWRDAIDALQKFRQGRGVGRNPGSGNRPGRSRWPEADTIRHLTKMNAPGHEPKHRVDGFYPRAAFGLPLVFHFKDKRRGDPKGQSGDSLILNPAGHERMASPLILRPWLDGQRYCPAALLLPGWEERVSVPVSLDENESTPAWPRDPDERDGLAPRIEPLHAQAAADALTAFMGFFEKQMNGGT